MRPSRDRSLLLAAYALLVGSVAWTSWNTARALDRNQRTSCTAAATILLADLELASVDELDDLEADRLVRAIALVAELCDGSIDG